MHAGVAVLLSIFLVAADETPGAPQTSTPSRVRRPVVTAVEHRPTYVAPPAQAPADSQLPAESRRDAVTFVRPTVPLMEIQARMVSLRPEVSLPNEGTTGSDPSDITVEPRSIVVRRSTVVTPAEPLDISMPSTATAAPVAVATNAPAVDVLPAVEADAPAANESVILTARRQSVAVEVSPPVEPRGLVRTPIESNMHSRPISTARVNQVESVPSASPSEFVEIDTGLNSLSAHHGSVYEYTGYLLHGENGYPFTIHQQPPRLNRKGHVPLCRSTCNLRQHVEYFPYAHGNYYFRPYTFTRLLQQQEQAARMGIDPRNPYSNKQYLKVYEKMDERVRVEEVPPGEIPGEIEGIEGIELKPEPPLPLEESDEASEK